MKTEGQPNERGTAKRETRSRLVGRSLPQFVRDLLASPPHRGDGLNLWFYRVARVLHPYRDSVEIIELLRASAHRARAEAVPEGAG